MTNVHMTPSEEAVSWIFPAPGKWREKHNERLQAKCSPVDENTTLVIFKYSRLALSIEICFLRYCSTSGRTCMIWNHTGY